LTAARRRDAAGDWIDIQVKDNGIGISKLDIQRLFQDYGQATPETATKYGGTGPRDQPPLLRVDGRQHFCNERTRPRLLL